MPLSILSKTACRAPHAAQQPDARVQEILRQFNVLIPDGLTAQDYVLAVRRRLRTWAVLAAALVALFGDPFVAIGVGAGVWIWAHYTHGRNVRQAAEFVAVLAKQKPQLIVSVTLEQIENPVPSRKSEPPAKCWLQLRDTVPLLVARGQSAIDAYSVLKGHLQIAGLSYSEIDSTSGKLVA